MGQILVSLMGEQTIPNILFIKEMQSLKKIDSYIFISTQQMEKSGILSRILESAHIERCKCTEILVNEYSLDDFEKKLDDYPFADEDRFTVNVTGGTKLMAIGAYRYFSHKDSEIFYVQIRGNTYRKIHPEVRRRESDLSYRINLIDYLSAHGISISRPHKRPIISRKQAEHILLRMMNNDYSSILHFLRTKRKSRSVPIDSAIRKFLDDMGFNDLCLTLTKEYINLFTGGWFEEFVYHILKDELSLDDDHIILSADLNIKNEIDVLFVHNNAICLVECKTGLKDGKRSLLSDTVYKVNAISRKLGLRVKPVLFTIDPLIRDKRNEIKDDYRERMEVFGIDLIDSAILLDETKLKDKLKGILI